jgi:putative ABC transport system permease protein
METLMQEISTTPGVTGVALSSAIPGRMPGYVMANNRSGNSGEVEALYDMVRVSHDFIRLYDLELVAGRSFSKEFQSDRESALVLTENSCKLFGFESAEAAVGQTVHLEGHDKQKFNVIGVTRDYNHMSLREAYRPIIFTVYNPFHWIDLQYITITSEHISADVISKIKSEYANLFPETSFDYFFLDDFYHTQYKTEYEFRNLTIAFTITAIIIICLGVFGISRLMLIRMEKEIGIRLINGADSKHIFMLVLRQFVYWLIIAFIIAIPLAWYGIDSWLASFSNRIVLNGWIFIAGGLTILTVTFVLVMGQSYRTVTANPIRLISRN